CNPAEESPAAVLAELAASLQLRDTSCTVDCNSLMAAGDSSAGLHAVQLAIKDTGVVAQKLEQVGQVVDHL
ncbi:hypothetical protein, partial [Aeromonas caviae]|uniref:hypothetical protein n=1 Tax=Aeromonas caviae TaxID=648 RepID=UPI001CC7AA3B